MRKDVVKNKLPKKSKSKRLFRLLFSKRKKWVLKLWWEHFCYVLETPIRVKEEYDRLTAEIKELENMK